MQLQSNPMNEILVSIALLWYRVLWGLDGVPKSNFPLLLNVLYYLVGQKTKSYICIAARDMTFSPRNPKKHIASCDMILSEKLILATSAKYHHLITSFTRPNATMQHTTQQHTRPNASFTRPNATTQRTTQQQKRPNASFTRPNAITQLTTQQHTG
jgi:hypothetical protein